MGLCCGLMPPADPARFSRLHLEGAVLESLDRQNQTVIGRNSKALFCTENANADTYQPIPCIMFETAISERDGGSGAAKNDVGNCRHSVQSRDMGNHAAHHIRAAID